MKEYVRVSQCCLSYLGNYALCFNAEVRMAKAARNTYLTIGWFNSTAASISAITDYKAGRRNHFPGYSEKKMKTANERDGTSMLIYTVNAESGLNRHELCTQKETSILRFKSLLPGPSKPNLSATCTRCIITLFGLLIIIAIDRYIK